MALKSNPRNKKSKKSKRTKICPEHKIIKGTNYTVDAFCYKPFDQKMVFFLSHFHADHYKGLLKSFSEGDIYCSPITASLVLAKIGVNKKYLKPLQIGVKHKIPIKPTNQIFSKSTYSYVTLVEANHCPGSVIFFFEIPNKKVILHTGDFRFGDQLKNNPICAKNKNVSFMYLDTTYCNPRFVFPTQKKCCEYVSQNIDKLKSDSKILFVIGSYNLGKEKIFVSVFKKTELQIYVDPKRMAILEHLNMDLNLETTFTTDSNKSRVHVLPLAKLNFGNLSKILKGNKRYNKIVAFKPTGWCGAFSMSKKSKIDLHNVPYSEHSSFNELKESVKFFSPREIIPTVNNETKSKIENMKKLLKT